MAILVKKTIEITFTEYHVEDLREIFEQARIRLDTPGEIDRHRRASSLGYDEATYTRLRNFIADVFDKT